MNEETDTKEEKGEILQAGQTGSVDEFAASIRGIIEPLAESQMAISQETTKQTQIVADTTKSIFRGIISVVLAVVVLSFTALFLGEIALTEKIVFALLGLLGGFGIGKFSSR